jgi:hypothetical protein
LLGIKLLGRSVDYLYVSRAKVKERLGRGVDYLPVSRAKVKERLGRGFDYLPVSRAKVKERVELYLYSSSASSWPVLR